MLYDIFGAVDSSQNGLIPEDDFWEMLEAPPPGKFMERHRMLIMVTLQPGLTSPIVTR